MLLAGMLLGAVALYFALRTVSISELKAVVTHVQAQWLLAGFGLFGVLCIVRGVRWYLLLRQLGSVEFGPALEGTIVGFAANWLMPARLGELFRADYMKRIAALSRIAVVGAIGIERAMDGFIILMFLVFGVASLASSHRLGTNAGALAVQVLGAATLAFVAITIGLIVVRLIGNHLSSKTNPFLQRVHMLTRGVRTLNRATILPMLALTLLIWTLEVVMLWVVLQAFDVSLSVPQLMVLCVCAALSTLIPTAPGSLGTLQFVFSQLLLSFGKPPGVGIAAATAMQAICYLPYALLGVSLFVARWVSLVGPVNRRRQEDKICRES